jgi:hypothetical protein
MSRGPYTAEVGGASFARPAITEVATLMAGRSYAESYGTTADYCHVYDSRGVLVASYHRDTAGDGTRWFKGG